MATPYQLAYPDLGPRGALPNPRHPYFNLGDDGLGEEGLDDDTQDSASSNGIEYIVDDYDERNEHATQSGSSYSQEDEDVEYSHGVPFLGSHDLDANTPQVDADFVLPINGSESSSEVSSTDLPIAPKLYSDQGEGRRGALRGNGRGRGGVRGKGRGRGLVLGAGSQGGITRERERGRGRGRARGHSASRDDFVKGSRPGKRGPRATAEPSYEFKDLQAKATTAFLEKSYDAALEYAKQAVQINPEIFAAHSLMSQIYFEMGMKEESVGVLWSGAHTRRDPGVWWEVANRTLELGVAEKVAMRKQLLYCYSQITRLDPSDVDVRKQRMEIFIEEGQFSRAIRECLAILKLRPTGLDLLQTFTEICIKGGEPAKAKAAYQVALEHYQKIQLDGFGGEFTFSDLNIYLELFIDLKEWSQGLFVLKSIARWLCGRRDETFWDECQQNDCEWDLQDEPRRAQIPEFIPQAHSMDAYGEGLPPEIRSKLGIFRLNLGRDDYGEAKHHFDCFEPHDRGSDAIVYEYPDVFREIADALLAHSYAEEALKFYEALKNTLPVLDTSVRRSMADCHRQLSQWQLATQFYESVINNDPGDIEVRVELAKVYEELGDSLKAFEHVAFAIKVRRTIALAAAAGEVSEFDLGLPDSFEAAGIPITSSSVHSLLRKLVASMPKGHSNKSAKIIERHRISTADTMEVYAQMMNLLPDMRAGDKEAEIEWTACAARIMEDFKSEKVFYPPEKYIKFFGYSIEARRKANKIRSGEPLNEMEAMADRLQTALGDDVELEDEPLCIPDEYHGILFKEWLDIFCEYALRAALNGNSTLSYDTLTHVTNANVFYHDNDYLFHAQVCCFTCALVLQDEERLCMSARWFWKQFPFATDTFRLFAALNRLHYGEPNWYNAGPTQKYILRTIKHMDFALLDEENRKRFKFSSSERVSAFAGVPSSTSANATPGNPHGLICLDPALLTLYGHLLASASSYPNALIYYLRAYAIDPTNALVVFSISLAYLQYSLKRQAENRHYLAMQGIAFFNEYKKARFLGLEAGCQEWTRRREEVEFNEGRMWQLLGLMHLAVASYERSLAIDDYDRSVNTVNGQSEQDVRMTDADDGWVAVGNIRTQHDSAIGRPDFKREAAFALQTLYALGGDLQMARQITERWLVF